MFRQLTKHKLYTLINLVGLAVGIACGILALLVIQHEFSYDRMHDKADRIVRVLRERASGDGRRVQWPTSGALARAIESDFPEVEAATKSRLYPVMMQVDDQPFPGHIQGHVDEHFFPIFDFPFIRGDEAALDTPFNAAITPSLADLLFPGQDPIGKTVHIEERYYGGDYVVAALVEDPPETSSIQFELLHKTQPGFFQGRDDWVGWQPLVQQAGIQTFVLLRQGTDRTAFEHKLPDLIERQMGSEIRRVLTLRLQPFLDWHLYSNLDFDLPSNGDIRTVYLFATVAIFILLIAGINYTNIATAKAVTRAREVGLRKTVGAERAHLIRQFLAESVLTAVLSAVFAIVIVQLALPHFNLLAYTRFTLNADTLIRVLPGLAGITLLSGLLAGLYPAFVLSSYQPITVLNAQSPASPSTARLRKGLVVFQFAISIALIITVWMTDRQLDYLRRAKLGFDKERVIVLPIFRRDRDSKTTGEPWLVLRYNVIKDEFRHHPDIVSATAFRFMPGQDRFFSRLVKPEGHEGTEWRMPVQECDESFFEAFGIELLAGRTFSPENERDRTHGWVINQSAVKALGWTVENAVGRRFGRARSDEDAKGEVIGVIADFNYASLHEPIGPAVMGFRPWFYDYLGLRISGRNVPETIAFITDKWKALMRADQPPEVWFLDDRLAAAYESDRRFGQIVTSFAILAVFLGSLGLFGLASYSVNQRVREIGVRKVLGATTRGVWILVSRDFLKLVGYGCLVAWPASYWLVQRYLEDFAYRAPIAPTIFIGSALLALLIALLTISYQAITAARTDPVTVLRHE